MTTVPSNPNPAPQEYKRAAYHAPVLSELGTVRKKTQAMMTMPGGTDAGFYVSSGPY